MAGVFNGDASLGEVDKHGADFSMRGPLFAILEAGYLLNQEAGSAGSTGRGEANILIAGGHTVVEMIRQGKHPKDACLEALRRIAAVTRERRLLDGKGRPNFSIRFYALNKRGAYGSAAMWSSTSTGKPARFAVADAKGARLEDCAALFEGHPPA